MVIGAWRLGLTGICLLLASRVCAGTCHLMSYGTLPVAMHGERPTTVAEVNGKATRFILDTGAFYNMMPRAEALSLGLSPRPAPDGFRLAGVGGATFAKLALLKDFHILGTTVDHVWFVVGGTDSGHGLLGANLLDLGDLEIDLANGKMTLFRTHGCRKSELAYWTKGGKSDVADTEPSGNVNDRRTFLKVTIDGKRVRAVLDSGAYATVLSRDAAKRIGIDLDGPGVKAGRLGFGIGARSIRTWTVPIDSFSVGTETIRHSQMQVIDGSLGNGDTDMLLGVDFLLAHHVFIANSQKKMYFTYNGGRVFTLAKAPEDGNAPAAGTATDTAGAGLATAGDYALRGEAHLSRGELDAAVDDLGKAIAMAPDKAAYYLSRARAYAVQKRQDAARADLDKSLSLDPKDTDALLLRAELRLSHHDRTGAATDVAAASALAVGGSPQARLIASLDMRLGQPAQAIPLLDDWIRVHEDDARLGLALNVRCLASGLSNQTLDQALRDCRKAIRRDGKKPNYLESLGLVQLRLGHYAKSIKAYDQAVAKMPRSAWSWYGLGLAEIHSGHAATGNADLAGARALAPGIDATAARFGLHP